MAFRTAPSQRVGQLKPAPGMRWPRIGLLPSFVHRVRIHEYPAQGRVGYAPIHRRRGWVILLPRGPRSGPGCAVPVRHHLIDPICPTAGTSRLHRKAAYTRCLRCAGAPRRPASGSGLSLTIPSWHAALYDPGEFDHRYGSVLRCRHGLRRDLRLGTPKIPAIRFTRGTYFGVSRFTYATACQVARPPLTDRTRSPLPQRAFTSRLPAVWSPSLPLDITTTWAGLLLLAGLAPARMAASLAAPDPRRVNGQAVSIRALRQIRPPAIYRMRTDTLNRQTRRIDGARRLRNVTRSRK
jgi:hypothetical protein